MAVPERQRCCLEPTDTTLLTLPASISPSRRLGRLIASGHSHENFHGAVVSNTQKLLSACPAARKILNHTRRSRERCLNTRLSATCASWGLHSATVSSKLLTSCIRRTGDLFKNRLSLRTFLGMSAIFAETLCGLAPGLSGSFVSPASRNDGALHPKVAHGLPQGTTRL